MDGTDGRGQTTLDFAVGVALFIVATVFVLSFVPGMLEPFEESDSENNVVADRVASDITEGQLADPASPFVLDPDCTRWFFGADDGFSDPGDCKFEDVSLEKRLGVQGLNTEGTPIGTGPNVNVTVLGDFNDVDGPEDDEIELLCVDANSDARIVDGGDRGDDQQCDLTGGDDDFLFAAGPTPPTDRGTVAVARRVVSIEGKPAIVVVRVWS